MPDLLTLPPTVMILNAFQKAVLKDYSDGDYAYLIEDGAIADVQDLGDTLLTFLMIELSTKEDCDTIEDAQSRMLSAHADIEAAILALDKLQEAIAAKLAMRAAEG
jgi:fumarylacetoacetate (FAA) hydrolase family protein